MLSHNSPLTNVLAMIQSTSFLKATRFSLLAICPGLVAYCCSLHAGDEQWDGRFGDLPHQYYGQLITYSGAVYGSGYKWDGTNLVRWAPPGNSGDTKAAIGTDLFVGGNGATTSGLPGMGVARWDGTNWYALGNGIEVGFTHFVASLLARGSDLYAGGYFTGAGTVPAQSIARWDGTNWYDLGAGLFLPGDLGDGYPPMIYSLVAHGNSLYASGQIAFDDYNGVNRGVVRWDGTNWSALDGTDGTIHAMALNGNDLLSGGNTGWLRKWEGTNWTTIGRVNGWIYAIAVGLDAIYVGGNFSIAGGVPTENIARWDGTKWSALGSGLAGRFSHGTYGDPNVISILVSGSDVIVSGYFTSAGGKPSIDFAIWHELPSLKASYGSGNLQLSWPASFTNYVLESSAALPGGSWTEVSPPATNNQYATPLSGGSRFFRLRRL
jgi:trimeric autotransporter adhesin